MGRTRSAFDVETLPIALGCDGQCPDATLSCSVFAVADVTTQEYISGPICGVYDAETDYYYLQVRSGSAGTKTTYSNATPGEPCPPPDVDVDPDPLDPGEVIYSGIAAEPGLQEAGDSVTVEGFPTSSVSASYGHGYGFAPAGPVADAVVVNSANGYFRVVGDSGYAGWRYKVEQYDSISDMTTVVDEGSDEHYWRRGEMIDMSVSLISIGSVGDAPISGVEGSTFFAIRTLTITAISCDERDGIPPEPDPEP